MDVTQSSAHQDKTGAAHADAGHGAADHAAGGSETHVAMEHTLTQIAQAAGVSETIPMPKPGEHETYAVHTGVHYVFDFPVAQAQITLDHGDLHILLANGAEIILKGYAEHAAAGDIPPINFAGETVAALDLLPPEALAEIAPAAGPVGPGNTGFTFNPFAPGPLPPGIDHLWPLPPTGLAFVAPFPLILVLPARAEELALAEAGPECFNFALPQLEAFFDRMDALTFEKPEQVLPSEHPESFFDNGEITVVSGAHEGTFGNDSIDGGTGDATIGPVGFDYGNGGNALIDGKGGNDCIVAGAVAAGKRLPVNGPGYFSEAVSGSYVVGRCLDTAVASGAVGTGAFNFATIAYMGNSGEVA